MRSSIKGLRIAFLIMNIYFLKMMNAYKVVSGKLLALFSFLIIGFIQCKTSNIPEKTNALTSSANVVVAHRGAWKNTGVPQNSMASLKAAIALGCAGSEFDIHMTADSVLVIYHDAEFMGVQIQKENYSQLDGKLLSNGEPIPLLKDFIRTGKKQKNTKLVLEIKPSIRGKAWALATAGKVVELVENMKAGDYCLYISFDYDILKEIVRLNPKAQVQYLNGDKSPEVAKQDGISGLDYHYNVFIKNEGYIEDAKMQKLILNSWTINTQDKMEWFLDKSFNYITTDEPELLLGILKSKAR